MSLFGTLNTAVSGMTAQASKLGTIGDNIANSGTTGYKTAGVDFETLLGNQSGGSYQSGGVVSNVIYNVSSQGNIVGSSAVTNMAVKGAGFFVVADASGQTFLTRAGDFVPDKNGNLVNAAGYKLMAYDLANGSQNSANGVSGLQAVQLNAQTLSATPSKTGSLSLNLPSGAAVTAGTALPSTNPTTGAVYSGKTSMTAYDNLGNPVTLDIYLSHSATTAGPPQTEDWEATVFNAADEDPTTKGFPYANAALSTQTLTFDDTTGKLVSGNPLTVNIPNGAQPLTIDVSKTTQFAAPYQILTSSVDGSSPSTLDHIAIDKDGTLTSIFKNGVQQSTYKIPLATVPSIDKLTPLSGNVYQPGIDSGSIIIGGATTGPFGEIDSSSLEQSTVDIATELTQLITTQRNYEANSKIIQTSSELLSVVTNLK